MSRTNAYTRQYYECGIQTGKSLYENYHWLPEMTIPMAQVMIDYLGIKRGQRVLDVGCAKGYLVKAMRWLGREAWGCDISDYALESADPEVKQYLSKALPTEYFHFAISKDTFEHIKLFDIRNLLTRINSSVLFIIVPLGNGRKYNIPAYELDTTHIHRQPLIWWNELLKSQGWKIKSSVPRVPGIKDNWTSEEMGNGFIVAEKCPVQRLPVNGDYGESDDTEKSLAGSTGDIKYFDPQW